MAQWRRWLVLALAVTAGAVTAFGPARPAAALSVDLELVLAVDVSGSIDAFEFDLQRRGYSDAFRDARVLQAIQNGPQRRIAVTMVEWSGSEFQTRIVGWKLVSDAESAHAFAEAILEPPRSPGRWTSISGGIDFSVPLFADNGFEGARKVIDVSGDGVNNSGRPAADARDDAVKQDITINGLAIINDRPNPFGGYYQEPRPPLDQYFLDNVIGGPGAFLIVTHGFKDFTQAVIAKLIREIVGTEPGTRYAASPDPSRAGLARRR